MALALLYATLAPFVWGFMNVFDKYIVSHKVKNAISFAVVTGLVNILFGVILALFLDWEGITAAHLAVPVFAGVLLGIQFYVYYHVMAHEDAASMVGLVYVYPLLIAAASYLFLDEVIHPLGYVGMAVVITGSLLLSWRLRQVTLKVHPWLVVWLILLVAAYEFFIKVATESVPPLHGTAISSIAIGLVLLPALLHRQTRADFPAELRLWRWALFSEFMTLLAVGLLFLAMDGLPATIVASVGATQPLIVLFFERIAQSRYGRISRDNELLPKLVAICLIVIGVALLYLAELA